MDPGPGSTSGEHNRAGHGRPDPAPLAFGDLAGNRHRSDIARLVAAGIVTGRTATTFVPDADVTREQMASLLVRFRALTLYGLG